jgi:hypothetical protein
MDLTKLEKKVDDALEAETNESLKEFITEKRTENNWQEAGLFLNENICKESLEEALLAKFQSFYDVYDSERAHNECHLFRYWLEGQLGLICTTAMLKIKE